MVKDEVNLFTTRELFVRVAEPEIKVDDKKKDEEEKKKDDEQKGDDGILKLEITDSKYEITIKELQGKLGKCEEYAANIVDTLGKNRMIREDVKFVVQRGVVSLFSLQTEC